MSQHDKDILYTLTGSRVKNLASTALANEFDSVEMYSIAIGF